MPGPPPTPEDQAVAPMVNTYWAECVSPWRGCGGTP
jgi:hypothetical protein